MIRKYKYVKNIILVLVAMIILPIILSFTPIWTGEIKEWFGLFGEYIGAILAVIVGLIVIVFEMEKNREQKNRESRIEIFREIRKELDYFKDILDKIKLTTSSVFFSQNLQMVLSDTNHYNKKTIETEEELVAYRMKNINIYKENLKELILSIRNIKDKKIYFIPLDEEEKKKLNHSLIVTSLNSLLSHEEELIDHRNTLYASDASTVGFKYVLKNLSDYWNTERNIKNEIGILKIYIEFSINYFNGELLYTNDEWKEEYIKDYNKRLEGEDKLEVFE